MSAEKKQVGIETEHGDVEVESIEQNHATSQNTQLQAAENQMSESRNSENQGEDGSVVHTPSEITNSEPSTTRISTSLTTEQISSKLNVEKANAQTPQGKGGHHSPGRSTGPRTSNGKKRSSQNATKSGIFSRATLLKDESASDYQSLLQGLWRTLKPKGKLEQLLVEKLAIISWRYRRLLVAETAEIRKYTEFVEFDECRREQQEADGISQLRQAGGTDGCTLVPVPLICKIRNPNVVKLCIELLFELRQRIKSDGLDWAQDSEILKSIYGDIAKPFLRPSLYDDYSRYYATAQLSESERQSKGYATPEECKQHTLQAINAELRRLKRYEEECESNESKRRMLEVLRHSIPDSRGLDRLLRYEASLERAFDRTLSQLERLQRIRKGQSVPPTIKVDIS